MTFIHSESKHLLSSRLIYFIEYYGIPKLRTTLIMTSGWWNVQRLEHTPRQQLPARQRVITQGAAAHVPDRPLPLFFNHYQPGPLITSIPPLLVHHIQTEQGCTELTTAVPDSTEIQHFPPLKGRGVARQEVTRVGQSRGL